MKVAVGISGGVDSTVAALLLKEQGHEVIGVTMTLGRENEGDSLSAARAAAARLGIPLKVFDFSGEWREKVLRYVRETYLEGKTPNPCVRCNERVKFGLLPQAAFECGCERFATGHYARVVGGESGIDGAGGVRLLRAIDRSKDQSYFLYRVRREVLARTIFPLGELTKMEVREKARQFKLEVADKNDSQDFCGGEVSGIVGEEDCEGDIVTVDGKVVGKHRGFWHYTVGMRRGLGVGGGIPYYVVAIDAVNNRLIVGFKEAAVRYELNLVNPVGEIDFSLPVKVRSAGEPRLLKEGLVGVAPGQSAVFYRGDEVVGGGEVEFFDGQKSRLPF